MRADGAAWAGTVYQTLVRLGLKGRLLVQRGWARLAPNLARLAPGRAGRFFVTVAA